MRWSSHRYQVGMKNDNISVLNFLVSFLNVLISDAKEDRRNASKLYNPIILEKMEVLSGHPPSWVEYVDKLIVGHEIPSNEVGSN